MSGPSAPSARPGPRSRRELAEAAVGLAARGRWRDAERANRSWLRRFGPDGAAYRRLGRALTQLGRLREAEIAYETALELEPGDPVARHGLARLRRGIAREPAPRAGLTLAPGFFVEEPGRTVLVTIPLGPGERTRVAAGDRLGLALDRGAVVLESEEGIRLGRLKGHLATHLARLLRLGYEYESGVVSATSEAAVLIREVKRGRPGLPPSFPLTHREVVRPEPDEPYGLRTEPDEEVPEGYQEPYAEYGEEEPEAIADERLEAWAEMVEEEALEQAENVTSEGASAEPGEADR